MCVVASMCFYCERIYQGRSGCLAFPDGIPREILDGDYDHRHPYPGDHGVRFEAEDEQAWQDSLPRQTMDGELEDYEWLAEAYARRAAEKQGTAAAEG